MDQSNRGIATSAAGTDEDVRLTYDVPEAGRLLGLSRNGAYAAAKAGLIPVLNIGGAIGAEGGTASNARRGRIADRKLGTGVFGDRQ